jgi:hypothetical protein
MIKINSNIDEKTELKKIYLKIQKDWNLNGKLTHDFIYASMIEFKKKGFPNIDDKIIEDFSKDLIEMIYTGIDFYLGKLGVSHIDMILKKWIEKKVNNEIEQRIKVARSESTESKDPECNSVDSNNVIRAEGGLVYIQ